VGAAVATLPSDVDVYRSAAAMAVLAVLVVVFTAGGIVGLYGIAILPRLALLGCVAVEPATWLDDEGVNAGAVVFG
jgi:hypothetical protein